MGCQQDHPDHQTCTECEFDPFVRNHFFTGKMMGAGEFITESRYQAEKMRHHNLRLHGWGVVCGLRVRQHPSPDCRSRYVLVDPGSALDCCGREILLTRQEILDLGQHPEVRQKTADGLLHALQVALCYRECPTEEVPVLYDECGCDDTQCAPNRILESFSYDVLVDPPLSFDGAAGAALGAFVLSDLHGVTGLMRASAAGKVALIDPGNARHAWVLDPAHRSLLSLDLPAPARALAMAPDGVRLFVVTDPVAPGTLCEIHVYLSADGAEVAPLVAGTVRTVPGTSANSTFAAASGSAAARRLLVLDRSAGQLYLWAEDASAGIQDAASGTPIAVPAGSASFCASEDGAFGFTIGAGGVVQVIDCAAGSVAALAGLPAGARPNALAPFVRGADAMLAVASGDERRVYLVNRSAATLAATLDLAHPPLFLHASSGSAPWLTVYEEEAGHGHVQAAALATLPPLLSAARRAGSGARRIVLVEADGQASLLDPTQLAQGDCASLLCRQMDGCGGCDTPDCVVLATLANYLAPLQMLDLPAQDDDRARQIVRIDNRRGRRVLASSATLQAWLECLQLKNTAGRDGSDGRPGRDGVDGLGLDANLPKIIDIGWAHGGMVGLQALDTLYSGITDLDDARKRIAQGVEAGAGVPLFTLYFNRGVTTNPRWWRQLFKLRIEAPLALPIGTPPLNSTQRPWLSPGFYMPLDFKLYGDIVEVPGPLITPHTNETANCAVSFILRREFFRIGNTRGYGYTYLALAGLMARLANQSNPLPVEQQVEEPQICIEFKSAFAGVTDAAGRILQTGVIDGDNIGGRVGLNEVRGGPILGGRNPSGNLTQGGTFESWITVSALDRLGETDLAHGLRALGGASMAQGFMAAGNAMPPSANLVSAEQLGAVPGIQAALAKRFMAERARAPFAGVEDLQKRLKLDERDLTLLTDRLLII
ncbi:hypothetical protein IV454_24040 [Massilia antarctica]|uniref:Uncharacterized protein n=1 Tax=Massilia antarctica TaxID=2765360 RepID=A0AA49A7A1_9BURK|nr:hypothetical protein [Massilia antarctica]QPI48572.1 hypothetical protein IV454_24040 [Massilia antarctica]